MKDLWLKKKAESEFLAGEFEAFSQLIRFPLPEISNDAQVS